LGGKDGPLGRLLGQGPGAFLLLGQMPRQEGVELFEGLASLLGTGIQVGQQDLMRVESVPQVGLR